MMNIRKSFQNTQFDAMNAAALKKGHSFDVWATPIPMSQGAVETDPYGNIFAREKWWEKLSASRHLHAKDSRDGLTAGERALIDDVMRGWAHDDVKSENQQFAGKAKDESKITSAYFGKPDDDLSVAFKNLAAKVDVNGRARAWWNLLWNSTRGLPRGSTVKDIPPQFLNLCLDKICEASGVY